MRAHAARHPFGGGAGGELLFGDRPQGVTWAHRVGLSGRGRGGRHRLARRRGRADLGAVGFGRGQEVRSRSRLRRPSKVVEAGLDLGGAGGRALSRAGGSTVARAAIGRTRVNRVRCGPGGERGATSSSCSEHAEEGGTYHADIQARRASPRGTSAGRSGSRDSFADRSRPIERRAGVRSPALPGVQRTPAPSPRRARLASGRLRPAERRRLEGWAGNRAIDGGPADGLGFAVSAGRRSAGGFDFGRTAPPGEPTKLALVSGPTTPSTTSPPRLWRRTIAPSVRGPRRPSIGPGSCPSLLRTALNAADGLRATRASVTRTAGEQTGRVEGGRIGLAPLGLRLAALPRSRCPAGTSGARS